MHRVALDQGETHTKVRESSAHKLHLALARPRPGRSCLPRQSRPAVARYRLPLGYLPAEQVWLDNNHCALCRVGLSAL